MNRLVWTLLFATFCGHVSFAANVVKIAALSEDPQSISPFRAAGPDAFQVINPIFESLMVLNSDGQIEFGLAMGHKQISPTRHRFFLRKGVRFHNGELLTADSVKATFDAHLNPEVDSSRRYVYSTIKSVKVEDPYTVLFETREPDNIFLHRFVLFSGIVPKSLIQKYGPKNLSKILVGAGPFRFAEWVPGKRIRLERNPYYYKKGYPKADTLIYEILPREEWKPALLDGRVDVVPNLPGKDARVLAPDHNIRVVKKLVYGSHWLLLNNRTGPLADKRVREALNLALNRADLIEFAAYGNGVPLSSVGFRGEFGAQDSAQFEYNPEKAKKLLAEAGFANGVTLKAWITDVSDTVGKVIKKQLSLVGVKLDYEALSSQEYARRFQLVRVQEKSFPKDLDVIINLVGNPFGHIGFHLLCLLQSDGIQSLTVDKKFDTLLDSYVKASTPSKASSALQKVNSYINDETLIIPTYQVKETVALRNEVVLDDFSADGNFIGNFISEIHKKDGVHEAKN